MADAIVSDPYVGYLLIEYEAGVISALRSSIAYDVQVDGLETVVKEEIDAWALFNQGDKIKFQSLIDKILANVE